MAVNLDSVFLLVKYAVAQMKRQPEGGKIVLVSSTAGQRGEAFHCDYAATKGAVISMVKGLSTELARDGIHVNCVAPGWVATDMTTPVLNDPAKNEKIFATIPLGTGRHAGRTGRAHPVPVHRTCRICHRRGLQREWRRRTGG